MAMREGLKVALKNAGVKASNFRSYEITPQEAAKRFMVDIMRPAITSYDVRTKLSSETNKFELNFDDSTVFTVASANGVEEKTLDQLIPVINKHNLCIATTVFPKSGVSAFVYDSHDGNEVQQVFTPVENEPWGFPNKDACIAWYRSNIEGVDVISALVIVPGYRPFCIKDRDENKGIILEDTARQQVFVPYGEFSDILKYETKINFLRESSPKITAENFKFKDRDFVLVATKDDNFSVNEKLQKISGKDFIALRDRFNATGQLDAKTCYDEDNVTISIPWVAYFTRRFKITGQELYIAALGAPGYTLEKIVSGNREEKINPCIYVKDKNGHLVKIYWLNYHDCLSFEDFKTWESSPERNKKRKKFRKVAYPGVGGNLEKPMLSFATQDAAQITDEETFDMGVLEGVVPLKK